MWAIHEVICTFWMLKKPLSLIGCMIQNIITDTYYLKRVADLKGIYYR
jgi:hypothetical protein